MGGLKNVNVALYGMKNINLIKESIKMLEAQICYDVKIRDDLNFNKIIKHLWNVMKL